MRVKAWIRSGNGSTVSKNYLEGWVRIFETARRVRVAGAACVKNAAVALIHTS